MLNRLFNLKLIKQNNLSKVELTPEICAASVRCDDGMPPRFSVAEPRPICSKEGNEGERCV